MKLKTLLGLTLLLPLSVFANNFEGSNNVKYLSQGDELESTVEFPDDNGEAEEEFNRVGRSSSDKRNYFSTSGRGMDGTRFLNISGECRIHVILVTSGSNYYQLYHHISQPWTTHAFPSYSDGNTWVKKGGVTTMPCSQESSAP